MFFYLLVLFTAVPLIELALLVWIGTKTSVFFTVGLVMATGVVGAALARWQGLRTVLRIRQQMADGQVPADALVDGLMILVAGALLLTPGVLTDVVGFGLLMPPLRHLLKRWLRRWFERHVEVQSVAFSSRFDTTGGHGTVDGRSPRQSDKIIDAHVTDTHVVDDKDVDDKDEDSAAH